MSSSSTRAIFAASNRGSSAGRLLTKQNEDGLDDTRPRFDRHGTLQRPLHGDLQWSISVDALGGTRLTREVSQKFLTIRTANSGNAVLLKDAWEIVRRE